MKIKLIVFFLVFFLTIFVSQKNLSASPTKESIKTPDQIATEMQASCQSDKSVCYNRFLYELARENGYDLSYQVLLALQKKDSEALQCHLFAHTIGKGVYQHDPKNWKNILAKATPACSYGVGHGLIETYSLALEPGALRKPEILLNICKNQPPNCMHVVGHAIILEYKGDLNKSIAQCDIFNDAQKKYCYNGAFMENAYPETLVEHGLVDKSLLILPPRLPTLAKLCNDYTSIDVSTECWGQQVHPLFEAYGKDYQKAFDFCGQANTLQAATKCVDGMIGGIIVKKNFNLDETRTLCDLKARHSNFKDHCYAIIVSTSLTYLPYQYGPKTIEFCNSLTAQYKANCFQIIQTTLSTRIKDQDFAALCKSIPQEYLTKCPAK